MALSTFVTYLIVVTGVNRGMIDCEDVYHSSPLAGLNIGENIYRWPKLNIAVIALVPAVCSDNSKYFQVNTPTCLLRSSELINSACSVDRMLLD